MAISVLEISQKKKLVLNQWNLITKKIKNAKILEKFIKEKNQKFYNIDMFDNYHVDCDGNTLLHLIIQYGNKDKLIHLLKKLGLNTLTLINKKNNEGKTPIDLVWVSWQRHIINNSISENKKNKRNNIIYKFCWELDQNNIETRIMPGRYMTEDLNLFFSSKNKSKECQIPDKWAEFDIEDEQNLTLHQRLSMIEAFTVSQANYPKELKEELGPNIQHARNYVAATLGFVVSTQSHKPKGSHKREFIILPIDDPNFSIFKQSGLAGSHSEKNLFFYLKNKDNLERLILDLSKKLDNKYGSHIGHKIYAVILDIHSTRSMCDPCEQETYLFQGNRMDGTFLNKLETILKQYNYKLPKEKTYCDILTPDNCVLRFATRVSASMCDTFNYQERPNKKIDNHVYHYPRSDQVIRHVISVAIDNMNIEELQLSILLDIIVSYIIERDIKKYHNSVILHTNSSQDKEKYESYKRDFYFPLAYSASRTLFLSRQTIFANTNSQTESVSKSLEDAKMKIKF